MDVVYVILLYLAAVVLIFCELFVPGGIVGTIGLVCMISSIVLAFRISPTVGGYVLAGEIVGLTVLIVIGLKIFPYTWTGRRLILGRRLDRSEGYHGTTESLQEHTGKKGQALSMLRPSGIAVIDGKRVDVVSEGEYIEKGSKVEVVSIEGNRVIVRRRAG